MEATNDQKSKVEIMESTNGQESKVETMEAYNSQNTRNKKIAIYEESMEEHTVTQDKKKDKADAGGSLCCWNSHLNA